MDKLTLPLTITFRVTVMPVELNYSHNGIQVRIPPESQFCNPLCVLQVDTNKGPQPRCLCPKHRTGLFCDRPNLCLDHCLNGGTCQFTRSASGEADGMAVFN